MFLHQLSSLGSSCLPRVCPTPFRFCVRSSSSFPALHPWRGFPSWPPRLPTPTGHEVFTNRTLHPHYINHCNFSSWRSFYSSAGLLMERPDRNREPPFKRRKNEEERRGNDERGGHGGLAAGSKREHHHLDPRADSRPRPNHHYRDGGWDRRKNEAGNWVSQENKAEKTKTGNKDSQQRDGGRRDENQNQWRSNHRNDRQRESHPTVSRAQTHESKPEQGRVPAHKPKPNPSFKERASEEQARHRGKTKAPEDQRRDIGCGRGQRTEPHSRPCSTSHPTNQWQVAGVNRQPPPPESSPPATKQTTPVKSLQRHWETSPSCSTDPEPPGVRTAFDFSVMSYNILSQELLQDNAYLYRHCDPAVLPWEHRLPNLLAEIQQHDADILCLQEVQEDHYENQIKPALQALGYQCEYKKRTGRKPDGCAIIFKSSRLSLISSNPVEFFRCGDALLDRDNIGLVVLLRPNIAIGESDPSSVICVANTHLLYNPRRGDIKLAQLAILLAEINRLSLRPDGSKNPVLLCGDFNSTPWSPLYSFLTTGQLDCRGLQISMVSGQENVPRGQRLLSCPIWSDSLGINQQCQYEDRPPAESSPSSPSAVEGAISNLTVENLTTAAAAHNRERIEHSLKLQSSYRHRLMPDGRPEITTCHSRTAITVDYILFTPVPSSRGLQLLGRLSLVGQPELEEVNCLPNWHHSSDHLPLLVRFRLRL